MGNPGPVDLLELATLCHGTSTDNVLTLSSGVLHVFFFLAL